MKQNEVGGFSFGSFADREPAAPPPSLPTVSFLTGNEQRMPLSPARSPILEPESPLQAATATDLKKKAGHHVPNAPAPPTAAALNFHSLFGPSSGQTSRPGALRVPSTLVHCCMRSVATVLSNPGHPLFENISESLPLLTPQIQSQLFGYIKTHSFVTEDIVRALVSPTTEHLDLSECAVSLPLMEDVISFAPSLRSLQLSKCRLEGGVIPALRGLTSLTSLELCDFTLVLPEELAAVISVNGRLTRLSVAGNARMLRCSKDALRAILTCAPLMTSLDLSGTNITDADLAAVAECCPSLASLTCAHCRNIGDEGVAAVTSACSNLQHLDLCYCPKVTLAPLARAPRPSLTRLAVASTAVDDDHLIRIAEGHPDLSELDVSLCRKLTCAGLAKSIASLSSSLLGLMLAGCPVDGHVCTAIASATHLKSLSFSGCAGLSDSGIQTVSKCRALERVCIAGCHDLTHNGANELLSLRSIRILDARNCSSLPWTTTQLIANRGLNETWCL